MNTKSNSVRRFAGSLGLAAFGLAATMTDALAVRMDVTVYAKGVYALVVPGSNTGGRVIWSSAHIAYITDRVSRGEQIWVTMYPTVAGEYATGRGYTSTTGTVNYGYAPLVNNLFWRVPTSPASVNLSAWVCTNCDVKSQPLPIGSRP